MIKTKKQMFIVLGVFTLVMLLGTVTYAFFNYTRTGTANTISTGQINFLTTQSNTLSLTNVFPIASSEVTNANLDEVEIRIQGDTTYSGGEEFEITIEGLTNTIGTSPNEKTIPINFIATYIPTASGDDIGSAAVSDYFSERGSTTTVYSLTETGVAENGKQILVGYIPANGEIDGTLKVSAYIDSSNIAISDTYYENVTTTPTPSAPNDEYGTTTEWVAGRTVLTTDEWNALQNSQTPLSFKIKAESNEGVWAKKPGAIEDCPGCQFMYSTIPMYTSWNTQSQTPTELTSGLSDSYLDVVNTSGKNYFLGVKLNGSNQVTNAYVCGLYNGTKPFCIEGISDGTNYSSNSSYINSSSLWNNTCTVGNVGLENEYIQCDSGGGMPSAGTDLTGYVSVSISHTNGCAVYGDGEFECFES